MSNIRILGYLSTGSYASIFKIIHLPNRQKRVLKVLPKEKFRTDYKKQRVVLEKLIQFAAQSQFVVAMYFAFEDHLNLYLGMEYAKYGDLSRFVRPVVTERLAKLFLAQMILAIEYLHRCQVVHRDLKLTNFFVFNDGYIKLGDLGLAKRISDRTYTAFTATPYVAPEMLTSDGHGRGVDFWSLGIILYRMLYNKHPFVDENYQDQQLIDGIRAGVVRWPSGVDRDSAAAELIKSLLKTRAAARLGNSRLGLAQLKRHKWLAEISFQRLVRKEIRFEVNLTSVRARRAGDFRPAPAGQAYDEEEFRGF
ncbi:cAMP-dependent protein kinase catalytic subunit beta-like [Galendromus occidentalis]|uniref:cAMP-dependent protein kinase catalytic subunit beta-like n=1 Tax=Galendromus occidentalis TaxID=34638 RepID=A0AAJ6QWZ9_9ACAR|nr:cAMP-dependent protein kinase catalytic subunit beta-like [Galendromus occidentalis]